VALYKKNLGKETRPHSQRPYTFGGRDVKGYKRKPQL
jgi:hypothetical protein